MMAQMSNKVPRTPRQAARRRFPIDRLLEPELFKALGDPTRARIFACLCKCSRDCAVTEIAPCCEVDLSVVSRHLSMMERSGLVESRREGRTVLYRVRYGELAARFRALGDAIEGCDPGAGSCGSSCACVDG